MWTAPTVFLLLIIFFCLLAFVYVFEWLKVDSQSSRLQCWHLTIPEFDAMQRSCIIFYTSLYLCCSTFWKHLIIIGLQWERNGWHHKWTQWQVRHGVLSFKHLEECCLRNFQWSGLHSCLSMNHKHRHGNYSSCRLTRCIIAKTVFFLFCLCMYQ